MSKRLLTIAGATILVLASTVPFVLRIDDPFEGTELRTVLLELRGLDAALTSDVLELRLGIQRNYDLLTSRRREIEDRSKEFLARSSDLDDPARSRLHEAFSRFQLQLQDRARVLEVFPVDNATLNNSLRLLTATYERARAHLESQGRGASEVASRLEWIERQTLQYFANPSDALRESIQRELKETSALLGDTPGTASSMLGHARIVVDQKSLVDDQLRLLVETSGEPALIETCSVFEMEAHAAAKSTERHRAILSAICLLAVVLTCSIGAWSALRQNSALEREIRERVRIDQEARKLEAELRQAQKLESLGQLAAGVAHEINTPVQFVSDSVHFVRDAVTDLAALLTQYKDLKRAVEAGTATVKAAVALAAAEEDADLEYLLENVPKALERSLEGIDRVATIVRSLKEFAHPEQKEMAPVDLNQAIRSTLTIARNEYKYVADVETDFGELPPVVCNGGNVNQVVLNILVNAAHAITEIVNATGVRGRIVVKTRSEQDTVVIWISDTGGGIPDSVRDRIFDPFFTTKEVGKGTGQGLAIARSVVVDKHGGSLTFETQVGEGTTFCIRLPLAGSSSLSAAA